MKQGIVKSSISYMNLTILICLICICANVNAEQVSLQSLLNEMTSPPLSGEAGFAASGTAITVQGMDSVWIGTGGGRVARVYRSVDRGRTWSAAETPLPGGQTAGIFGIAFRDALNGVAVGGDYTRRYEAAENVIRTDDGGLTWRVAGRAQPFGQTLGVVPTSEPSQVCLAGGVQRRHVRFEAPAGQLLDKAQVGHHIVDNFRAADRAMAGHDCASAQAS